MIYIRKLAVLFCMISSISSVFGAQIAAKLFLKQALPAASGKMALGIREFKIKDVKPLSEQQGVVVAADVESVIQQAQYYLGNFKRTQAAISRQAGEASAQAAKMRAEGKELDKAFQDHMRNIAIRMQGADDDLKKAQEHVDEVVENHLGIPRGGSWSGVIAKQEAMTGAVRKIIEEAQNQEVPYLKTLRAAESVMGKTNTMFMGLMAEFTKKAQVWNGLHTYSLGLLSPIQMNTLLKGTSIRLLALPQQTGTMRDFEDQSEDVQPQYVPSRSIIGRIPLKHMETPVASIPDKDTNAAAQRFKDASSDEHITKHVVACTQTMNTIMSNIHAMAAVVAHKPHYHSKSYLLAGLGLVGGVFAYTENIPFKWLLPGLLGSFGLGGWSFISDRLKRNHYERNYAAFNASYDFVSNATEKYGDAIHTLPVLQEMQAGLSKISTNSGIAVVR